MNLAATSSRDHRAATRTTIRAVLMVSAVLTIVLLISFLFGGEGINQLQQSRKRVAELQQNVEKLQAENQRLAAEIASVKQSTLAVERIAREDLGMSKPGEVVYMLPPPPPGRQPKAARP